MEPEMSGQIDLNAASEDVLIQLPGIGAVMAQRIVAARPFERLEDLARVRGIGTSLVERIRSLAFVPPSGDALPESEDVRPDLEDVRPDPEDVQIKDSQQISHGECAADMRGIGPLNHPQGTNSNPCGQVYATHDQSRFFSVNPKTADEAISEGGDGGQACAKESSRG